MYFFTLKTECFVKGYCAPIHIPSVNHSIPTSRNQTVRASVKTVYSLQVSFVSLSDGMFIPRNYFTCNVTSKEGVSNDCLTKDCVSRLSTSTPTTSFF
jgi:hypothetical protein